MTTFQDDLKLFEQAVAGLQSYFPLYTIDRGKGIVGKEFTYKGKQMVVVSADDRRKTISMVPLVRGKPDRDSALIIVARREFDNIVKHHLEMREGKGDKKKRCSCLSWPYSCCDRHFALFAPFYGKGDGKSAAAISTGPGYSGGGPAYPGAGGVNAPGVGSGPNSGMGPAMSSAEFSGASIMEDVKLISQI